MKKTILIVLFGFTVLGLLQGQQQTGDGGYVIGGTSESYVTGYTDYPDAIVYKLDGSGDVDWTDHQGGVLWDSASEVIQTADGGYLVVGASDSFSYPEDHLLVYKLDAGGHLEWRKDYGEAGQWTAGFSCRQTADGGYIVLANVLTPHPLRLSKTNGIIIMGDDDIALYKLSVDGDLEWRRIYGGDSIDYGSQISLTPDGGYILVGNSATYTHGVFDILVYKLDADGQKQWRKNYGGANMDFGISVAPTPDGGYILGGDTYSYGVGMSDLLLYKVDAAGNKQWRKTYGSTGYDFGAYVRPTGDGGYIVCGDSDSFSGSPMNRDILVYKVDAGGQKQWRKTYGGSWNEYAAAVFQTTDGGYLIFGGTSSYVHGVPGMDMDFVVYKVDAGGQKQWRKNYGGTGHEFAGLRIAVA